MNFKTLKTIIKNKKNKSEFAIIRNLATGETELFEKNLIQSKKFEKYRICVIRTFTALEKML